MKYLSLLLAGFLMACTVPPDAPKSEAAIADSKPVDSKTTNSKPAAPKPAAPKVPAIVEFPAPKEQCASIKTGDVKEDINLKLDCLLTPAESK